MEREVSAVLRPVGVEEKLCQAVARNLHQVEITNDDVPSSTTSATSPLLSKWTRKSDEQLRWSRTVGLTAFLLRFGEGLEEVPTKRLFISAFTIGFGYLLGGLIPLLPYFFTPYARTGLIWSSVLTGVVLLVFGWVKTHVTGAGQGWLGYLWGALSTLLVGGAAAGAAYGIVAMMEA